MFGRGTRKVTGGEFANAVVEGIKPDMTHLYLMFQAGGDVIVKWEGRRDRRRAFRIVADADGKACPHCAVLVAITRIGDVLPLGGARVERLRHEYLSVVTQARMLPCPAIGRAPSMPTPFGDMPLILGTGPWMAECHAGRGDPSTPADCARHRPAS